MALSYRLTRRVMGVGVALGLSSLVPGVAFGQAASQTQPVLLVLDKDAFDYGPAPHLLPADAVNTDAAGVGARDELSYFASHVGSQVVLTSRQNGSDGWFALRTVPQAWATEPGSSDGLDNFALAGRGLGSPDDNGDRESLLESVPDVTPLRVEGLTKLVGRTACAVVYNDHVAVSGGSPGAADLRGATLGRIAFAVVGLLPTDDPSSPNVQVEIVEGHETCSQPLIAFSDAPDVIR